MAKLRCISVHSVKGGVGKSTLSYLLAKRCAETAPVLLVDVDLTGTSHADVLRLQAPDVGEGRLNLNQPPAGWVESGEVPRRMEERNRQPGLDPWALPFLNDFLLATQDRFDAEKDILPQAILWKPEGGPENLRVCPSSALPRDLRAILPVIFDELHAGFLEGRLEWLIEQVLKHTDIRTIIFDSPPTIPGLSSALLSMAMRLPEHVHLAPDQAEQSPPLLFAAEVDWTPLLIVSPDHQDLRAAERWLEGKPESELARIRTVLNLVEEDEPAPHQIVQRLRHALAQGAEPFIFRPEWAEPPTDALAKVLTAFSLFQSDDGYSGSLFKSDRVNVVFRRRNWRAFRPGAEGIEEDPKGLDYLFSKLKIP